MLAIGGGLFRAGAFGGSVLVASALALAPASVGMAVGQWARLRTRPETFRLCFLIGLLALGAHLALRGLL
jgi:hypothetical protein